MAHPLKGETNASHSAKLRKMTEDYGEADKKDMQYAGVNKFKIEGPEESIGFGADSDRPNLHGARRVRKPAGGNAFATYKRGGRVKHRASGGDTSDIEQADIDQKLESGKKHGGRVRHRAEGGVAGEHGEGKVKMGAKQPSQSSEPSPTPVDNRARGGRTGGKKKGGTHVNIMIAPQHGQPGAAGMPPISALPTPPPMRPPGGPPGMPPGGMPPGLPPGAGPPPGGLPVLPPGAAPPGVVPPGLAARPPIMPRERGGRVVKKHHHDDAHEDAAMIKHMVKESALKPHGSMRAAGGRIGLTAGAYTGEGRLQNAAAVRRSGALSKKQVV